MKKADFDFLDALQTTPTQTADTDSDENDDDENGLNTDTETNTDTDASLRQKKKGPSVRKDPGASKPRRKEVLPPIQVVLTKCDLVSQVDLARRVVQVRKQLSDSLRRQPSSLPVMLVSAKPGVGFNCVVDGVAQGGVLELQRELAGLVPPPQFSNQERNDKSDE